jgi:hypothetical protein
MFHVSLRTLVCFGRSVPVIPIGRLVGANAGWLPDNNKPVRKQTGKGGFFALDTSVGEGRLFGAPAKRFGGSAVEEDGTRKSSRVATAVASRTA